MTKATAPSFLLLLAATVVALGADKRALLFNLRDDPAESHNVIAEQNEVAK